MIVMSEISFEKRLFKGFVLPGVAVGVLLVLLLFVQPWISTDLLTRRIGGPAGMTIGFAMVPFAFLFMAYMMVAVVYAVLLTVKYFRNSAGLIGSARRFMLFSEVFLVVMDLMILSAFIETARWNYISALNLSLIVPLTVIAVIMTVFFISWTGRVYQHEGRKFLTWKTAGSLGLCLFLLLLPFILLCMFLIFG